MAKLLKHFPAWFVPLMISASAEVCPAVAHAAISVRDCSAYRYAPAGPVAPKRYVAKYKTPAHVFLDEEKDVGPVSDQEYAVLDSIIDDARAKLTPLTHNLSGRLYDEFAVAALRTIDCVLVSHGIVYPGLGQVQLLSDGLAPTIFTESRYYDALLANRHNAGRTEFIAKRKPGPYYVMDCDVASFLYLAIGDAMKYPISLAALPTHVFVRWVRPDGSYIDFETEDGEVTNDESYRARWSIPPSFVGSPGVLTTLTLAEVRAYHQFTVAVAFTWKQDYQAAIREYRLSLATDSHLSDAANNLAWLYTVAPALSVRDAKQAEAYALRAVSVLANGDTLDTLACAYGVAGRFADAVGIEERAISLRWAPQNSDNLGSLVLLSSKRPCHDPNFGKDSSSFRQ